MEYRIFGTHPDTMHDVGPTNTFLFGEFAGEEDNYSRNFASRREAEAALDTLNTTGDWENERPVYEIEEV